MILRVCAAAGRLRRMPLVVTTNRRTFLGALTAGLVLKSPAAVAWPAPTPPRNSLYEKLLKEYENRQARFSAAVLTLAAEVQEKGMGADANELRAIAQPLSARSLQMDDLPETLLPEIPLTLLKEERDWRLRLRGLEADYATDLFKQGEKAILNVQISLAWRLIREAAFRNPDHLRARETLGYVRYENAWTTPFRKQKREHGFVWHDSFGWLPADDLPNYLMGQRRAPDGQWVAKARDESIRANFALGWEVDSEHFHVKSNHSLERTAEISVELERFHNYFVREFAAVFMTPQQMKMLFAKGGGRLDRNPHIVHYRRNREEFQEVLMLKQPEAAFSDGMYMPPPERIAYFFDRPNEQDKVAETMYHEVTHQILSESATKIIVGNNWVDGDFWLVEGLACYLESFQPQGRGGTVGDPKHLRIDWAKRFLVDEGYFIPLEKFTAMTQSDFQAANMANGPARVNKLQHHYAQAAGVTHFFMHSGDGKYRDALITYLSQIYSANQKIRKNNATLAELTSVPFRTLDAQYAEYMSGL